MPRQKSLITVIRDLVRQEISQAISGLLGGASGRGGKTATRRARGRAKRAGSEDPAGFARRGEGRSPSLI